MKNRKTNVEDCKLNNKTFCECYLKQCYTIEDCAPKLIIQKNMDVVNNLISAEKELKQMKYIYKNKQYTLLYDDLKVKDSNSREWKQGVLYEQVESGLMFVREKEEFFKLFKEV